MVVLNKWTIQTTEGKYEIEGDTVSGLLEAAERLDPPITRVQLMNMVVSNDPSDTTIYSRGYLKSIGQSSRIPQYISFISYLMAEASRER